MKNYFYYDIFFSLDEGLMDEWIGNHFWPISPEKTQQILNEILEINFKIPRKRKGFCSLRIVLLLITIT